MEFDGMFTCNCDGTGFSGTNCGESQADAAAIADALAKAATSTQDKEEAATMTSIVVPAAAIFAAIFAIVIFKYCRRRTARKEAQSALDRARKAYGLPVSMHDSQQVPKSSTSEYIQNEAFIGIKLDGGGGGGGGGNDSDDELDFSADPKPAADGQLDDASLKMGAVVKVEGYDAEGTIRYLGLHKKDPSKGHRVLVELTAPVGKNDGTVKGVAYCDKLPAKTGVLVPLAKVRSVATIPSTSQTSKFVAPAISLGINTLAAKGLNLLLGVDPKTYMHVKNKVKVIEKEFTKHGTFDDNKNRKGLIDGTYVNPGARPDARRRTLEDVMK
jgi:hypothetical protein